MYHIVHKSSSMKNLIHLITICFFMSHPVIGQVPLNQYNDEFDNAHSLKNWKLFHEQENWPNHILKLDINKSSEGAMHLEPQVGFWYGEVHGGPFIFKEIEGNFTVTTRIKVNGRQSETPEQLFSLAGLMIRSPRNQGISKTISKQENWLFISTGFAEKTKGVPPGPQFETKVTINSKSNLKIYPAPKGWVDIAISRVGNTFYLLNKDATNTWQCIREVSNPNMKDQLQVGFIAYTDFNNRMKMRYLLKRKKLNTTVYKDGTPDVIARIEYFRVYGHNQDAPLLNYDSLSSALNLP